MRVKIKICGTTRLEDAHFAEACGADYIGFIFAKQSARCVTEAQASSIIKQLTHAKSVGVFVEHSLDEVQTIADQLGLAAVQVYQPVTKMLHNVRTIEAILVEDALDTHRLAESQADYFLLDGAHKGKYGGLGLRFDWGKIPRNRDRIIVAGGITPDNIEEAVQLKTYGLDICSGVELNPGVKDFKKIEALFNKVKMC